VADGHARDAEGHAADERAPERRGIGRRARIAAGELLHLDVDDARGDRMLIEPIDRQLDDRVPHAFAALHLGHVPVQDRASRKAGPPAVVDDAGLDGGGERRAGLGLVGNAIDAERRRRADVGVHARDEARSLGQHAPGRHHDVGGHEHDEQ